MGVKERRTRQKESLRHEILEAAGELFAREGYENVSMRKIAEKIEYSPTTIYLYFRDKADLLEQICDETFARLIQRIDAAKVLTSDPVEALRRGCRAYIDFGVQHPHHYLATFVAQPAHTQSQDLASFESSMGGRAFQRLRDGIQACVDSGQFRPANVLEAATCWWAAMHGITLLLIARKRMPWMDNDRLIENTFDLLTHGMQG